MKYQDIVKATFLSRPNRFIAVVDINGQQERVHVKNTGRCREILIAGVTVYLEPSRNPNRKTKYSLISLEKGNRIINIDSQAPNKILEEALSTSLVEGFPHPVDIRREYTYNSSRLDFLLTSSEVETLVEVKGVTLEMDNAVYFPDAPTLRGIKHLQELIRGVREGYNAIACFVIQLENVDFFSPNDATHPEFGEALKEASSAGVKLLAFECKVAPDEIVLSKKVKIKL